MNELRAPQARSRFGMACCLAAISVLAACMPQGQPGLSPPLLTPQQVAAAYPYNGEYRGGFLSIGGRSTGMNYDSGISTDEQGSLFCGKYQVTGHSVGRHANTLLGRGHVKVSETGQRIVHDFRFFKNVPFGTDFHGETPNCIRIPGNLAFEDVDIGWDSLRISR